MIRGETETHRYLKSLALLWAQQQAFPICGLEVRLPRSGFRADVAAYRPARKGGRAVSAVFECKQSRSDFLKDSHSAEASLARLQTLEQRKRRLEQLLGMHYPSLRKGESLFEEYDAIDPQQLEHKTYREVLREIGVLQNRLYGKTKFEKIVRYAVANVCYLVVEPAILAEHEAPRHWGLLERIADELVLRRRPTWQEATPAANLLLLESIAAAGTRAWNRQLRTGAVDSL